MEKSGNEEIIIDYSNLDQKCTHLRPTARFYAKDFLFFSSVMVASDEKSIVFIRRHRSPLRISKWLLHIFFNQTFFVIFVVIKVGKIVFFRRSDIFSAGNSLIRKNKCLDTDLNKSQYLRFIFARIFFFNFYYSQ